MAAHLLIAGPISALSRAHYYYCHEMPVMVVDAVMAANLLDMRRSAGGGARIDNDRPIRLLSVAIISYHSRS